MFVKETTTRPHLTATAPSSPLPPRQRSAAEIPLAGLLPLWYATVVKAYLLASWNDPVRPSGTPRIGKSTLSSLSSLSSLYHAAPESF